MTNNDKPVTGNGLVQRVKYKSPPDTTGFALSQILKNLYMYNHLVNKSYLRKFLQRILYKRNCRNRSLNSVSLRNKFHFSDVHRNMNAMGLVQSK